MNSPNISKTYRRKFASKKTKLCAAMALALLCIVGLFLGQALFGSAKITAGDDFAGLMLLPMLGQVVTDEQFKKSVTDTLTEVKDAVTGKIKEVKDDLVAKYDNLAKDTKKAFEDLTLVKNKANESHEAVMLAIQKVNVQMQRERRMASGDPIQRIQQNDELRTRLNLAIRLQIPASYQGDSIAVLTKALGTGATPGSTMVMTDELLNEIYSVLETYGVWRSFKVTRLGTKLQRLPVATARPIALFVDEAAEIAADANKAGTEESLTPKKAAVMQYISGELLKDSSFDVSAMVLEDFGEAMGYRMDWCALNGTGVANDTNGSMTGIFTGGTTVTAAAGHIKVETTTFEDWINVILGVDAAVLQRAASWWMHNQILVRSLAVRDGNNRPLFQTALEAPTARGIGSILGYPVIPAAAAPTANTVGSKVAVFGDNNANVVGIRNDFEFAASEHHRFNFDQIAYRGLARFGTKIRKASAFGVLKLPNA